LRKSVAFRLFRVPSIHPRLWISLKAIDLHRILRFGMVLASLLQCPGCARTAARLPPTPDIGSADYHLGPGDQVRIIIFGEEQMTGEFRVNASGDVALPLVGNVHAAGLTPHQLERATAEALQNSRLLKKASVSAEVIHYRPIFMLGEVSRPGQYPYQPGMTVVTAIAVAGGFTYRAVDDIFSIVRTTSGSALEGRAERQTLVQPGDVITVYERHF
jgi:polysaccharide biosynthesis/export protein